MYMRPFARIESGPTEMVMVGQTVSFTATEAATTLADLGYDSSLDFILGSGLPEDYIYEWYVNDIMDAANLIGSGRSIDYSVIADIESRSGAAQQTIFLVVTDITNPDLPSTTTSRTIDVYQYVYLPMVLSNYQ
jgi:hypothetical protein